MRIEVHSIIGSECLLKLGLDNASARYCAHGELNNLTIQKPVKSASIKCMNYVEIERHDDPRWLLKEFRMTLRD